MSDSVPLLSSSSVTSRRRCSSCPSSYRFQFIHSKGALLVLFWNMMISISQNFFVAVALSSVAFGDYYYIMTLGVALISFLAGYFGDFFVSRYKVFLVGSYITFILLIPFIANYLHTFTVKYIPNTIGIVCVIVDYSYYCTC